MHPELSIVVPLYNEQESLPPLHEAITRAVEPLGIAYEIVFVDDGSRDATAAIAVEIAKRDPHVCLVRFRRNYGQTPAMAAGIEQARGEVIVTMDGDLQNDPDDIAELLAKIDEGYDIAVGWRHDRQDKLISRRIPSRIANRLIARATGVPIKDNGCSLKAYRASLIKKIPLYSEMHRFIPAMASIAGPKIAEIKVRHHARQFGESKYGLSRIYKVLLDLLVIKTVASFTARPMLWFALLSTPLLLAAAAAFGWTVFAGVSGTSTSLMPLAGSGVIFLSSAMIMLCGGALGELVYKLGNLREHEFSGLTQHLPARPAASEADEP
ncbi:MAG: glycosyltransferase family 2 protein [Steroidobacteraceae bacterium]